MSILSNFLIASRAARPTPYVNANDSNEIIYQAREEFDNWGVMNRRKDASVKSSNPAHRSHKENVKRRAKRSASKKSKRMNRRK